MRIKYCSAVCGSGKTYQILSLACEVARHGDKALILQPTRELIDKTFEQIRTQPNPPPAFVFHRDTVGSGKVAKALAEHIKDCPAYGQIVLATHAVLPHIRFVANRGDWQVFVDEELQAVRHQVHNIPKTHELITRHLRIEQVNAIYGQVIVHNADLEEIARNVDEDEILETLSDTNRILVNPQWETFANIEQYERLRRGEGKQLAFHSVLKPSVLEGFASVFMASANFEDSAVYKVWSERGVRFEKDPEFAKGLRYTQHPNGKLVAIYYATEQQWSRKHKDAVSGPERITTQTRLIKAAKTLLGTCPFVWHANKTITDNPFGLSAQRLPSKPHGLNTYADIDNIVFLSSLNPTTDHFRFLKTQGLSGDEVRAYTYHSAAYQAAMRTSIRNPENRQPKIIIVPDRGLAEYLYDIFPGSKIQKLDIGLIEKAPGRRGRPKKHRSNRERVAQQRQAARDRRLRLFREQLHLNSPDRGGGEDCGDGRGERGEYRAEISIESSYSIFGTQLLTGCIFSSIHSSMPFATLSGETDSFVDFLWQCHERQLAAKDDNFLFSPAIFDPNRAAETKRGRDNIAYLRNLVLDFEGGELRPEEFAKLFPGLRLVVTNTFDHTNDKSRFRVVIPTSEVMSPEVCELIYGCLAEKIEDAGYSVDRGSKSRTGSGLSNMRPSGLDWSKSNPTSLFYLPCQAKKPDDSFFVDYNETPREVLKPSGWLKNMTLPLQPSFEEEITEKRKIEMNEKLIERAKQTWRTSVGNPGKGDQMFFNLGLSLRRAGMDFWQIENTLRAEAQYGRTPKERSSQISSILQSLRRYCVMTSKPCSKDLREAFALIDPS